MQRCHIHPEYSGDSPPSGFPCSGCWVVWITRQSERYQRTEFSIMKHVLLTLLFVLPMLGQQSQQGWLYGAIGSRGQWFTLGPTLKIVNGQLDAVPPPVDLSIIPMSRICSGPATVATVLRGDGTCGPVPAHKHPASDITDLPAVPGQTLPQVARLTAATEGAVLFWAGVPTTAKFIRVYVNGIRYWQGFDYLWDKASGKIMPMPGAAMLPEHDVRVESIE